ncbi:M23 family metallopeptidase [Roseibacillus ishigakijimensis]|uniref:M23 family metallopeptidase n=1 Tax=Roseibacillus ishigakijimensis TaxID=454146 RepID=A0A934RLC3_9BACT|nr:M23 family metallopeptidase [Roseibacillus ishigakijimensis]MBK1833842.1 M23 family metallopeptidase [Roseibacillus ishigakijimensis]
MIRSLLLALFCGGGALFAQLPQFRLPTANDALFRGEIADFYMPTNLTLRPPESGAWGFVRNYREFSEGKVYTRFHEGLDIRPVARNARGIPTDPVHPIADGVVVYVNPVSSRSNYGQYVVVQHDWGMGPFYSLYAHLASTSVEEGQSVSPGSELGILGSTGAGLNNERAHVHLELNIMYSERFDDWIKHCLRSTNVHGNHNGINLSGIDMAEIYLKQRKDPSFNLAKHLYGLPQHYRITVPRKGTEILPIVRRYRWMGYGNHSEPSKSWEMAFTRSGFLVGVAPSDREVSRPTVTYVRSTRIDHRHYTIGRLTGTGSSATLTASGERFIALVTGDFPSGDSGS